MWLDANLESPLNLATRWRRRDSPRPGARNSGESGGRESIGGGGSQGCAAAAAGAAGGEEEEGMGRSRGADEEWERRAGKGRG